MLAFYAVPVLSMLMRSVNDPVWTLSHYASLTGDTVFLKVLSNTLYTSLIVTLGALLLGYPVALSLVRAPRFAPVILILILLPFWTSVLVRAYAWLALLQRTGVINQLLRQLGVIDEPLALVHNTFGTVVATLHILLPFMVLPLYATMQQIPRDLMQAGARLGAGPMLTFRRIFLPLSLPGVLAGSTLVFVLSLGFYITPELLGGGRTIMISMLVSRNVELYDQWGAASAVGVVLLVAVGLIFFAVSRFIPLDRVLGQK